MICRWPGKWKNGPFRDAQVVTGSSVTPENTGARAKVRPVRLSVLVFGTGILLLAAGYALPGGAASQPSQSVRVELVDRELPVNRTWPETPPTPSESYDEKAFGFFHIPWRYTSTGVREDRGNPLLLRASATVDLPTGAYRVLLRARGAARLTVEGRRIAELDFPKVRSDGHDAVRHDFLELGPGVRYRAPGDREVLVEYQIPGGPQRWVLETIIGGKSGNAFVRPELGETLVAIARAGTSDFRLLAPKPSVLLTDAGWKRYRAERAAHYERIETSRRVAAREKHAPYWKMRHDAARAYAKQQPAPLPPQVSAGTPVLNDIDRFLGFRVDQARRGVRNEAGNAQFSREVLSILNRRCIACHSKTASGGLRLDSRAALLKGGLSGQASVVPGKPEASHLLARVRSEDPRRVMPPTGERLSSEEIGVLERWIKDGAVWPQDAAATQVAYTPLTDDLQFLRRVTLDLVGTVPTLAEIRAFQADRRPDRRARVIERLLADPRWADPWVAYWQDVLGENPNLVNATLNNTGPFRWWLYESFRDNKPLDLFVTELIRMEGSPYGGGPAGFGLAAMNDAPMVAKANIIGTAFLATEMKCARCHDAPYHATKQEDLFNLAAMLARAPVAVPGTSTVPPERLAGREALIKVTLRPGQKVPPAWSLDELAAPNFPEGWLRDANDSRERLAALVTAPWNERFAEVMVNRVWARYMGRGLVESVHDWEHAQPSHPELLRWLARELITHDYDLKHVTRLILNSHAYQRRAKLDPEANRLFAAPPRRRLAAEQVVDSLFDAFGRRYDVEPLCIDLDSGRPASLGLNLGLPRRAWEFVYSANDRDRPSLSLPRAQAVTELLEAFGWTGIRQEAINERKADATMLQPAMLANGTVSRWLTRLSDDSDLTQFCLEDRPLEQFVDALFLRVLTRPPTPEERKEYVALLRPGFNSRVVPGAPLTPAPSGPRPYVSWANHLDPEANEIRIRETHEARRGPAPTRRLQTDWRERMEDALWTLLNAPEIVYVP